MKFKLDGNGVFRVTTEFGEFDKLHPQGHRGLDLAMDIGTELHSPVDGHITKIVDYGNQNIGKGVFIKTDDGETVIMGHMSKIDDDLTVGEDVKTGELLGLSGSTGRSTGGHLHLGLKDEGGHFTNPDELGETIGKKGLIENMMEDGKVDNYKGDTLKKFVKDGRVDNYDGGDGSGFTNMVDFFTAWKREGFWHAMYGKSFVEVTGDFLKQTGKELVDMITTNGDLVFLIPAIIILFLTYVIGRHKYTKYTLPLFFAYFLSRVFRGFVDAK